MAHAGNHEEANPVVLVLAHLRQDAVVVINAIAGRNRRVVPAVIEDQLSTTRLERGQVGIDRINNVADFLIHNLQIAVEVVAFPIPIQIVVRNHE